MHWTLPEFRSAKHIDLSLYWLALLIFTVALFTAIWKSFSFGAWACVAFGWIPAYKVIDILWP